MPMLDNSQNLSDTMLVVPPEKALTTIKAVSADMGTDPISAIAVVDARPVSALNPTSYLIAPNYVDRASVKAMLSKAMAMTPSPTRSHSPLTQKEQAMLNAGMTRRPHEKIREDGEPTTYEQVMRTGMYESPSQPLLPPDREQARLNAGMIRLPHEKIREDGEPTIPGLMRTGAYESASQPLLGSNPKPGFFASIGSRISQTYNSIKDLLTDPTTIKVTIFAVIGSFLVYAVYKIYKMMTTDEVEEDVAIQESLISVANMSYSITNEAEGSTNETGSWISNAVIKLDELWSKPMFRNSAYAGAAVFALGLIACLYDRYLRKKDSAPESSDTVDSLA